MPKNPAAKTKQRVLTGQQVVDEIVAQAKRLHAPSVIKVDFFYPVTQDAKPTKPVPRRKRKSADG